MPDENSSLEEKRLAERYRELSDDGLSALAENAGTLTGSAREALNRELILRGLPPAEALFREDYFEARQPVLLQRFLNLYEAQIAKGQLESAGIPSSLVDDNVVRLDWFYSNLLGGVKLVVEPENEPAARELLGQPIPESFDVEGIGEYQQPQCPKCHSVDISYEPLDKVLTYGSLWIGFPIPFGADRWRCHACSACWQGMEEEEADAGGTGPAE